MPKTGSARSPSLTSQESYSAVIIADLVAEVQQQPESDKKILSKVREESSLEECDGKVSDISADVDHKTNGTNISKGVILNAEQFENDSKTVIFSLPLEETDEVEEEKGKPPNLKFSEMSRLRKIAFGFSFIPSIMFVLCFAVIFPCVKVVPCADEVWSISLNHTEVTSKLKVAQNLFFAFLTNAEPGLRSVSKESGETVWNTFTISPSLYTECGNLAQSDSPSCLVMDSNGTLSLYDQQNGNTLWQLNSYEDKIHSFPVIFPDWENDSIDDVAVAVSSSKIKVISLRTEFFIDVPYCETIPSNLIIWKKKNGTDLLVFCKKEENDILLRIPQNKWDKYNNTTLDEISILISTKTGVLSKSKLFSSVDGLTIWSENAVTMFDIEGRIKWTVSTLNHTENRRFILHGKVNKDEPRVILYSSDIEENFQITMMDFENGNITLSRTIPNIEISELILIHGEKYDFVLSLRKKFTKSFAVGEKISEISASVMNHLLTKEESMLNLNATSKIVEELLLMQLDGNDIQTLQTFDYLEGQPYSTLFTADSKESENLDIYVLRQGKNYTTLKKISVTNKDSSSAYCTWK